MSLSKKDAVKVVQELVDSYPIVGVVNMQNLPAAQLQVMRRKLRDNVRIFMTKKRLIKRALGEIKLKQNIDHLIPHLKGLPALLFTNENPFKLYALLQKSKSKAAARPGQVCPSDITIPAGPTQFTPGPIISELASFGLKSKVTAGKIEIIADKVVCKEGDVISAKLAAFFQKMGIQPMEIGLDLVAVYEKGGIYTKEVLAVDEKEYFNNFIKAHQQAFNLSVEAGILNRATVDYLLQKAFRQSKSLALEANILAEGMIGEILARAEAQAKAVEEKTK